MLHTNHVKVNLSLMTNVNKQTKNHTVLDHAK